MDRQLKIYRGTALLGYAGADDGLGPCKPFEPAEGFREVEALFQKEHELSMQLDNDQLSPEEELEIVEACDCLMEEILAPGVTIQNMDGNDGFECMQLTIGDGRVCWR